MSKRKLEEVLLGNDTRKTFKRSHENVKKHSLDSDEEDFNEDAGNIMDDNEFDGEEEGISTQDGEVRMTAFNMQEEMEMGHFDKQGHFIWNNEKEVRDNWLDNIDWQQIKTNAKMTEDGGDPKGLADESDSDEELFDEITTYKSILTYMRPKETITKTLRRLGGNTEKLSSIERLRRKKAGTLGNNKEVIELTELANKVLSSMGNMDIYQETYEQIEQKVENYGKKGKSKANIVEAELDMYADNFDDKEKARLGCSTADEGAGDSREDLPEKKLMWEFKWKQDEDKIEGPFTTEQMFNWSNDGHFKTGVWVRKCGDKTNFYTSNRIDFDLYL